MDHQATYELNRRFWDEVVAIHVVSPFYRAKQFLTGADILAPIESAEIGEVRGKSLIHLQCHFGLDTLSLARRGAKVTGLDFSPKAIAAARELAIHAEIDARFVESNLYDAPSAISQRFDIAYVTWGALNWLPDIKGWARVVATMLKPGGMLYLLEGHPAVLNLDQADKDAPLTPKFPYFRGPEPTVEEGDTTYTGDPQKLVNTKTHEWTHPLSAVLTALIDAGMRLDYFAEHDSLAWQLWPCLEPDGQGMYRLPAAYPSLPLSYSLKATKGR
jgi:SAM-dependent methyltransferase